MKKQIANNQFVSTPAIENLILKYQHAMQNLQAEISATHQKTFSKYKNKYTGKTAVLVAGGPTTKIFQKIEDAIYVSVNDAFLKVDLPYNFYFFSDYCGIIDLHKFLKPSAVTFFAKHLLYPHIVIPDSYYDDDKCEKCFVLYSRDNYDMLKEMIDRDIIYAYPSIVFVAIKFLLYANFKTIYIVGCDCSEGNVSTAEQSTYRNYNNLLSSFVDGWEYLKKSLQQHNIKTKIISVNPVGLRGLFEDFIPDEKAYHALLKMENGDFTDAVSTFASLSAKNPDKEIYKNCYVEAMRKSNNSKFLSFIQNELNVNPHWYKGIIELVEYYIANNDIYKAFTYLMNVSNSVSNTLTLKNIQLKTYVAIQLFNSKRYTEFLNFLGSVNQSAFTQFVILKLFLSKVHLDNLQERYDFFSYIIRLDIPHKPHYLFHAFNTFIKVNQTQLAESMIKKFIKDGYNYTIFFRLLFNIAVKRNRLSEAYKYAVSMFNSLPTDPETWSCLISIFLKMRRFADASRLIDEIENNYFLVDLSMLKANLKKIQGATHLALYYEKRGLSKHKLFSFKSSFSDLANYCNILHKLGRNDEVENTLIDYLEKLPYHPNLLYHISIHYRRTGNIFKSFVYSHKAHLAEPENLQYLTNHANNIATMHNKQEAISFFVSQQGKLYNIDNSEYFYKLCQLYVSAHAYDKAIHCCREAMRLDPHSCKYLDTYINILIKINRDEALTVSVKLLDNSENKDLLHSKISYLYMTMKDCEQALAHARSAFELDSDNVRNYLCLSSALRNAELTDKAEQIALARLETKPSSQYAFSELGKIYEKKNELKTAEEYHRRACSLDRTNLVHCVRPYIEFLQRNRTVEKVRVVLRKILVYNRSWLWGWDKLANYLNSPLETLAVREECLRWNPGSADANFKLAQLYASVDEYDSPASIDHIS
ncbi:MAG: tetratricopeptide repeat protein [Lachnospiraceae bacterium]|nr:tetratricopeptide repeat protein [Lachnospiraceae bacterium]